MKILHKAFGLRAWMIVAMLATFVTGAWAETVTYTISSKNTLSTTGTAPAGSSATIAETYNTSKQMTKDNSQTLTLSGFNGYKVTNITLSMKSNKSAGAGNLSYSVDGGSNYTDIVSTAAFDDTSWYGSFSTSYVNVSKDVEIEPAASGLIIKIAATVNSLYCESYTLTYTQSGGDTPSLETSDIALTDAPIELSFDLYNNSDAQVINYTTSSTGEVTIAESEYATFAIDEDNKTITVTPTAVTPSAQTITVNQAADETYKAGSATFTLTITDSTPIPTHTATFSVNGETSTEEFEEGATIEFPEDPADIEGKTFVGWATEAINGTTDEAPEFVTSATMDESDVTFYAVFAEMSGGEQTAKKDVLTNEVIGQSSYSDWTGMSFTSDAVYAGNSAGGQTYIQMRSNNNNSGIVTTTSGGKASKIAVVWASNTADGRTLDIYGSNTPYSSATDLYNDKKKGTKLGSIVCGTSTELTITGDYEYIGLRSNNSAMYLNSISITWGSGSSASYSGYCTTVAADNRKEAGLSYAGATVTKEIVENYTGQALTNPNSLTVEYASSNKEVATVDENGVVTVLALGETTITASFAGNEDYKKGSASYTLTIQDSREAIDLAFEEENVEVNVEESVDAPTLTGNTGNGSVTYSSSNTDIATVNTETGEVTGVADGEATITATVAATNEYLGGTATFTVTVIDPNKKGTATNPYTVAEAIAAIDAGEGTTGVYVSGIVCTGGSSLSSGSMNYWISDDGTETNKFEIYKGKGIDDANFTSVDDVQVGDVVTVYGNITYYKNGKIYEFTNGSNLVSIQHKPASDLAKVEDIALDFKNAQTEATLSEYLTSGSEGAYSFSGYDEEIISISEGVVTALKEGTTTITVAQAATLDYQAGEITIDVTVADTRTPATTIPAINISTLKTSDADGTIAVVDAEKADEGVTFAFASDNEDVLLIDGDAYTVGEIGTAEVTVTATASNSLLYKNVTATFTVTVEAATKTDSEIVMEDKGSTPFGTPWVEEYLVTEGYDGEVAYVVANEAIASVSVDADAITFTPKAVGTTTITFTAPATANFNASETVTYTLTVTAPEGQTIAPEIADVVVFNETFAGSTGSHGSFSGSDGNGTFRADNEWDTNNSYGAGDAAKFGSSKAAGSATTPSISATPGETYTLTFKAAPWAKETSTMSVSVEGGKITGIDEETAMTTGEWNDYTATITANAESFTITFSASSNRFFLDEVQVKQAGVDISATLNASGYASFCTEYPLDFTGYRNDGFSAWIITNVEGTTITFDEVTTTIKGGQGLILKGEPDATIKLATADSDTELTDNLLEGTLAPTYVDANQYYGLKGGDFVKVKAGVVKAGKAILSADWVDLGGEGVKSFTFIFNDTETGIKTVEHVDAAEAAQIFDLAGRRLPKATKGISIVNGKKVFVK